MYTLVIDSGNTFVKIALFNNMGEICSTYSYKELNCNILDALLSQYIVDKAIYCAVRENNSTIINYLEKNCRFVINFTSKTPIPLQIGYKTKSTLGVDRIAAAVGACQIYENNNILIIDFGSAITIDFVEEGKVFRGGNISPGAMLRFKSLNTFTDKLPLCTLPDKDFEVCATSTKSAIMSGVAAGILYETMGYIEYYKQNYSDLKIIFTGGDAKYFGDKLKIPIFVSCEIVTRGLYKILNENDKG